ncbi:MAG: hypothetical protein AAB524_02760 [Patescibacteria group bacterium]
MKFPIKLSGKTLYTFMRECGYAPDGDLAFHRFLAGRAYPKFHIYCALQEDKKSATLNLHLDQKQPSYKGSHAHNAEYDGKLIEAEAERIKEKARL